MRSAHNSARYAAGVLLAATALAATACSSSSSSSSTPASTASSGAAVRRRRRERQRRSGSVTNVTLGYVPYSDDASLFYAQSSGIFKKHGLNVTFVPQASPVAVEASMASGTEQFGFITTPVLINLSSKGVGVKCVSSCRRQRAANPADDTTVLVAAKGSGITSVKDLAGKNVAEVQLTSLNSLSVMVLAKQAGIDPHSHPPDRDPVPADAGRPRPGPGAGARSSSRRSRRPRIGEGATVLTHPNQVPVPERHRDLPRRDELLHQRQPDGRSEFRAAMNESIAYSADPPVGGQADPRQGPEPDPGGRRQADPGDQLEPRAQHRVHHQIENYMKQFGVITSEPPASITGLEPVACRPRRFTHGG